MSPGFVPPLKNLVRRTSRDVAREVARRVLRMKTAAEIRDYLTEVVRGLWPEAELLDTGV